MANIIEFVKFLVIGTLNTIIGLSAIYSLMFFWGIGPFVSNFIGYVFGIIVGYQLNRTWTFNRRPLTKGRFLPYCCVAAGSYVVKIAVVSSSLKLNVDPYLAQLMGIAAYAVLAYFGNIRFVFGKL